MKLEKWANFLTDIVPRSFKSVKLDPDDGHCPAVLEGTQTSKTRLPSETTQLDLNTSLDACPAEPLHTTLPEPREPSSESAATTEAHPTEREEKENDCIYLQYPLLADTLLCLFCYPVRGFQYIGNLKRIHSKQIAFRYALCDLPFETQKKCKSHQVNCKGHLKLEESNSINPCCRHPISALKAETPHAPALAFDSPITPAIASQPTPPEPQHKEVVQPSTEGRTTPDPETTQLDTTIERVSAASKIPKLDPAKRSISAPLQLMQGEPIQPPRSPNGTLPQKVSSCIKDTPPPQTELIHRRTSIAPETPKQDHIPKRASTAASKTVLPKRTRAALKSVREDTALVLEDPAEWISENREGKKATG
ncbi:unnamed protein product [Caretta caretta]